MSIIDLLVTGAIAAAAAAAIRHLRNEGTSCGPCANCPGSIYCKKKKD
jgi:hypothetical protein